jgi:hypothetical protein
MPLPPATAHDSHAIAVAVVIITGLCVIYWRTVLRLAVIIIVTLAALGLIAALRF